jgi:oxygen-independent coproporphyrinogen-3 oxidase
MDRCKYCGFVSEPHDPSLEATYVDSVIREAALWAAGSASLHPFNDLEADTLYFGGGTPSLLSPNDLARIVNACTEHFRLSTQSEISLEINPATISKAQLHKLRQNGINRASLGVQSLNDEDLRRMGRLHSAKQAINTFQDLRSAGFHNVSIDLMAGYPGQTLESFLKSLMDSLRLRPEHISVYLLEVKKDTELDRNIALGKTPPMDDDLAADMYEELCRVTEQHGYEQYEISNFALPGCRSRHNLKYWQDVPFLGLGPAAHGLTGRVRYAHCEDVSAYIRAISAGELPFSTFTKLAPEERFKDALIMGLRLVEGIDLVELSNRYRTNAQTFVTSTIGDLIESGLLSIVEDRLQLTRHGRLLSNEVFVRWI